MALSNNDPSSFSRPEDHLLVSIHLELGVDFSRHVLSGTAALEFDKKNSAAKTLLLDTRDLAIKKINCKTSGAVLEFSIDKPVSSLGSKLEIQLPGQVADRFGVCIQYETSPNCTALQWLKPEQTAGGKHPYLFSQCQAIHARSLLPCQDTPSVKTPYTAKITCDNALTALMSAVPEGSEPHPENKDVRVHSFKQAVPIPSYLIAVVAGALESRQIGPRSKVWSEKEMVDAAAYEFAETEEMIATAEKLLGPYVWGVYDLLVLPPSFPYGGMENPCLTFVTPTLLAGDRSLADVVAHEISHSWTGNLVTNSTWEHFWLNEGHTVFVERKIVGRMRGERSRHLEALGGWKDLQYQVEVFGAEHPYTKLVVDLKGVDPDDAFSSVPYEKGSNLLMYLEQKLGGLEVFEPWLRAYIEKFKYKSLTTDEWKAFLYDFFKDKKAILDEVDWDTWLYSPGMPVIKPKYDSSLADASVSLCERWSKADDSDLKQFTADDLKSFNAYQIKEFLAGLLEQPALSANKISQMEELYKLNAMKNSEIRFRWLRLCLKAKIKSAVPLALQFVTEQGRMKFVRPIYRDLYNWEDSRGEATENYQKNKSQMHNLTMTMVGKDLKLVQ